MEKNVETEVKLLVGKKELKELLELPLVAKRVRKGSHETLKLVNAYYDTKDLLLRQAGIAYRIRQTGNAFEQTVKMSKKAAGGLTSRGEYTVPAQGWRPDWTAFAGAGLPLDVEGLLGGALVEKLFSVRVKRDVRLLQVTADTVVEMAIDQGCVLAGKRKDTIGEVELELKEGKVEDLLAYIRNDLGASADNFWNPDTDRAAILSRLESGMDAASADVLKNLEQSNFISSLDPYEERGWGGVALENYRFPWDRAFEIGMDLEIGDFTQPHKSVLGIYYK